MADTDTFLPKSSDEEKKVLIKFYKENPALWNSSDPYYKNKVQRSLIKTKLLTVFENKYTENVLEKTFHSLRTSMLREVKMLALFLWHYTMALFLRRSGSFLMIWNF